MNTTPSHRWHDSHHSASDPAPVFILAPARSCSTVCLALLAGHPDIYGFPEMLLFGADTVGDLLAEPERRPDLPEDWSRRRLSGVLRAVADIHEGSQNEDSIIRAARWLTDHSHWSTVRLMEHLLTQVSPRIGVEKSPDTVHSQAALSRCVESFRGARFIHLTRHPVTTTRSMQRNMRPRWRGDERTLITSSVTAWHVGHYLVARTLAGLPENRWIRVRAEDLLTDTERCLQRILTWLALPHDVGTLSRMKETERWRFADKGPGRTLFGGDPGFLDAPRLRGMEDPGRVVFDERWTIDQRAQDAVKRLAAYLGY